MTNPVQAVTQYASDNPAYLGGAICCICSIFFIVFYQFAGLVTGVTDSIAGAKAYVEENPWYIIGGILFGLALIGLIIKAFGLMDDEEDKSSALQPAKQPDRPIPVRRKRRKRRRRRSGGRGRRSGRRGRRRKSRRRGKASAKDDSGDEGPVRGETRKQRKRRMKKARRKRRAKKRRSKKRSKKRRKKRRAKGGGESDTDVGESDTDVGESDTDVGESDTDVDAPDAQVGGSGTDKSGADVGAQSGEVPTPAETGADDTSSAEDKQAPPETVEPTPEGQEGSVTDPLLVKRWLDEHNKRRAEVKTASGRPLPPLVWDEGLARTAKSWSEALVRKGQWRHPETAEEKKKYMTNPACTMGSDGDSCGQNLASAMGSANSGASSDPDPEKSLKGWVERECPLYEGKMSGKAGHFSQALWADATKVGCGITTSAPYKSNDREFAKGGVAACNYDTGNIIAPDSFEDNVPGVGDCGSFS